MIRDVHPGSGFGFFTLLRGQKGTGSRSRIRNTATYHLLMPIEYHLLIYITKKTVTQCSATCRPANLPLIMSNGQ
jgi:hypothetical protein